MNYYQYPSCEMQGYGFGEIPPYFEMQNMFLPQLENDTLSDGYGTIYRSNNLPPYSEFYPDSQRDSVSYTPGEYTPTLCTPTHNLCTPTPTMCTPTKNKCTPIPSTSTSNRIQTEWEESDSGRRNLSKLLKCDYKFKHSKYLIFFTYSILADKNNGDIIWRDEAAGRFFIRNPKNFAQAWGRYKGNSKMNYGNVARSLRYYYTTGLLKKSEGLREYTWDRAVLASLRDKFKPSAPLERREHVCSSSNDCI